MLRALIPSLHSRMRLARRNRKLACRKCGYSLIGNLGGPECGTAIDIVRVGNVKAPDFTDQTSQENCLH